MSKFQGPGEESGAGRAVVERLEGRRLLSTATLEYEHEGFDLETGTVLPAEGAIHFPPEVDFHFAYAADRPTNQVVFQEYPAEIAFLDETPYEDVDFAVASDLTFTPFLIGQSLEADDTVVIRTAEGNLYKIGNAVAWEAEFSHGVTFDYELLDPAPATPESLLADLIDTVGGLGGGAQSLAVQLEHALSAVTADNAEQRKDAAHHLDAFIHQVEAQSGKKLTADQANSLIASAAQIRQLILG